MAASMLSRIALIAIAGAAGTLARYGVQVAVEQRSAHSAFATGAVNLVGCLLFGLALGAFEARAPLAGDLKVVVLTGFLGAFTTFSALLGDTTALARDGSIGLGVLNIVVQVLAGATLLVLGLLAGRAL